MKDAHYFSHDANARHDGKIMQMRSVYGAEGYGWYWMLVEKMREEVSHKIPTEGLLVWNALALELQTTPDKISVFVHDCIHEFKLFCSDNGKAFWAESLIRRMNKMQEIGEKRRKAALSGRGKANAQQMLSNCSANAQQMPLKEKKRKEKKEEDLIPPLSPLAGGATQPPPRVDKQRRPKKPGSRTICPDPFIIPDEVRDWCHREGLPDPDYQAKLMVSHFLAKGETRADWVMTFKNWMLSPYRKDRPQPGSIPQTFKEKNDANVLEIARRIQLRSAGAGGETATTPAPALQQGTARQGDLGLGSRSLQRSDAQDSNRQIDSSLRGSYPSRGADADHQLNFERLFQAGE